MSSSPSSLATSTLVMVRCASAFIRDTVWARKYVGTVYGPLLLVDHVQVTIL
jgi:hypothetical protein